jgi:bleomycin hydrolase
MNKTVSISLVVIFLNSINSLAQNKTTHKGEFREYKPGYYENSILKGITEDEQQTKPVVVPKQFKIDVNTIGYYPKSVDEFTGYWKNEPISQGNTSTCWSFSTTSFFETEIYRLTKQQVKLSQMYTAYWEYVEKAIGFVNSRGTTLFDEGSEANAVVRIYKKYGIVPFQDYVGLKPGMHIYDHSKMFAEMKSYLQSVKQNNAWDKETVVSVIKSIMNYYMCEPPTKVIVNGKEYTPQQYLKEVLKLNMDDYIDVTSILEKPFWKKVEYDVPDNWWNDSSYYNLPLDDYMKVIKKSIRAGYTLMIGGDVSEAGFDAKNQLAIVPSFDIPSEYIDDYARQFRFSNKTTTDDHGMHLIGYLEKDGKDWYLIKDSGSGSRNCAKDSKNFGYYFFHEDYVKLKMMTFLVHKDMMKDYLPKFK